MRPFLAFVAMTLLPIVLPQQFSIFGQANERLFEQEPKYRSNFHNGDTSSYHPYGKEFLPKDRVLVPNVKIEGPNGGGEQQRNITMHPNVRFDGAIDNNEIRINTSGRFTWIYTQDAIDWKFGVVRKNFDAVESDLLRHTKHIDNAIKLLDAARQTAADELKTKLRDLVRKDAELKAILVHELKNDILKELTSDPEVIKQLALATAALEKKPNKP